MRLRTAKLLWALLICTLLPVRSATAQEVVGPLPPLPPSQDLNAAAICPSPEEIERQFKTLAEIRVRRFNPEIEIPPDCATQLFTTAQPAVPLTDAELAFHWRPAEFFHRPLYFDDIPLERYGQSVCPKLQPVISGARFFATVPILPYKMGVNPIHECISTLGYYRPGSGAPCLREALPWEWDAALLEAGTVLGLVFLLP